MQKLVWKITPKRTVSLNNCGWKYQAIIFLKGDACSSSKKFQWDIHVNIWLQLYIVHILKFKFWWGLEPRSSGKKQLYIYTPRTLKHHIKHAVYMYYEKCLLVKELNIHINITKKIKTEITIQPSCFLSEWSLPSGGDTCIFTFVFALSGAIHVCRLLYSVDVHCWIWSVHHWGYFK